MFASIFKVSGQIDKNYMANWKKAYAAKSIKESQTSLKFCNDDTGVILDCVSCVCVYMLCYFWV